MMNIYKRKNYKKKNKGSSTPCLCYSRRLLFLLSVLTLFQLTPITKTFAEGSKDMYPAGQVGLRAYLQVMSGSGAWNPFWTPGVMKVYVKEGETLYVGSSAVGVTGSITGHIDLYAPNGAKISTTDVGNTTGIIATRAQELAGPNRDGVTNGYTPFTRVVTAEEEGIWEIRFFGPVYDPDGITPPSNTQADDAAKFEQPTNEPIVTAFDVSVGSKDDASKIITGRLFCNVFSGNMQSGGFSDGDEKSGFYAKFYVLTNVGYIYKVDCNGMNGAGFNFFSNNKGIQQNGTSVSSNSGNSTATGFTGGSFSTMKNGEPLYKSTSTGSYNLYDPRIQDNIDADGYYEDVTHKIFFNLPATDLPTDAAIRYYNCNGTDGTPSTTWLRSANVNETPKITNLKIQGVESGVNGLIGPDGAAIVFTSNVGGDYTITLGFTGSFTQKVITGSCNSGDNKIIWDGKDGAGAIVTTGTEIEVKGTLKSGEVHFPFFDVEINPQGIIIELLKSNGDSYDTKLDNVYWNDNGLTNTGTKSNPTENLSGISSTTNGHKWGKYQASPSGDFGNNNIIDTWSYISGESEVVNTTAEVKYIDLAVNSVETINDYVRVGDDVTYTVVVENINNVDEKATMDATNAIFGMKLPEGFQVSSVTATGENGTSFPFEFTTDFTLNTNDCTTKFNLANGKKATFTVTGKIGAALAHKEIKPDGYVIRPGDIIDIDASSNIQGAPTDAYVECNEGTSGTGCNNISEANTTIIVLNTIPTAYDNTTDLEEDNNASGNVITDGTKDIDVDNDDLKVTQYSYTDAENNTTTKTVDNDLTITNYCCPIKKRNVT